MVRISDAEFINGEEEYVVKAAHEVVFCADSIRSPQILEPFGIGDPAFRPSIGVMRSLIHDDDMYRIMKCQKQSHLNWLVPLEMRELRSHTKPG